MKPKAMLEMVFSQLKRRGYEAHNQLTIAMVMLGNSAILTGHIDAWQPLPDRCEKHRR